MDRALRRGFLPGKFIEYKNDWPDDMAAYRLEADGIYAIVAERQETC